MKKLTGSQQDTDATLKMPLEPTEMPANKSSNPIKEDGSDSAKGDFFGNLKKFITPSEEPKEKPLDALKSTPLETSLVPATNSVDNADKPNQPNLFDSVKQLFDKKDSQ